MNILFYDLGFSYVENGDEELFDREAFWPPPLRPRRLTARAPMDFDVHAAYKGRKMAFRWVTPKTSKR